MLFVYVHIVQIMYVRRNEMSYGRVSYTWSNDIRSRKEAILNRLKARIRAAAEKEERLRMRYEDVSSK